MNVKGILIGMIGAGEIPPGKDLRDVVVLWLELNEHDELSSPVAVGCGCRLPDLAPCDQEGWLDCVVAGYGR